MDMKMYAGISDCQMIRTIRLVLMQRRLMRISARDNQKHDCRKCHVQTKIVRVCIKLDATVIRVRGLTSGIPGIAASCG